jgi:hypothetical protein
LALLGLAWQTVHLISIVVCATQVSSMPVVMMLQGFNVPVATANALQVDAVVVTPQRLLLQSNVVAHLVQALRNVNRTFCLVDGAHH